MPPERCIRSAVLITKTLALGALPQQRLDKAEPLPAHFSTFSRYGCNGKHPLLPRLSWNTI